MEIVRTLRTQKGWSQEQLAEISGLSTRTIQRIEQGQGVGTESLRALAAAFEVNLETLQQTPQSTQNSEASNEQSGRSEQSEQIAAQNYVRKLRGFYSHLLLYVSTIVLLTLINLFTSPHAIWFYWPVLGWGIGVAAHAANVFELRFLFGADWEKKQIKKRLEN